MARVYERFSEIYQKVLEANRDRELSPKEALLFGSLDNLIFFEFMEKYGREVFNHNVGNYINPDNEFRLEIADLPKSARFFRGTNIKHFAPSMRYRLDSKHDTSWSYSPYEAADWLGRQKNEESSGVILVSDFGRLNQRGDIKQTDAGVFLLHSHTTGIIKPLEILTMGSGEYQEREFQRY
jgi:hypothetical protein